MNEHLLINAMIKQAAEDYANAYMGYEVDCTTPKVTLKLCEKFFRSDFYKLATNIDGELLMDEIRKNEKKKVMMAYLQALQKEDFYFYAYIPTDESEKKKKVKITIPPKYVAEFKKIMKKQIKEIKKSLQE